MSRMPPLLREPVITYNRKIALSLSTARNVSLICMSAATMALGANLQGRDSSVRLEEQAADCWAAQTFGSTLER